MKNAFPGKLFYFFLNIIFYACFYMLGNAISSEK
jgi:hypothetical protein